MKTPIKLVIGLPLLAGLVFLAGCVVVSVYPYYTTKDIVTDKALVGTWAEEGETNVLEKHWQFSATNGQAYVLIVREGEETTEFTARLFKLKNGRFIDAEPVKREGDFIPPHYLLQVHQLNAKELQMSVMDHEWLKQHLQQNPSSIAHLWLDPEAGSQSTGRLVLTADTAKLQSFVLKYAADTNAFVKVFKMVRR
jgi:hypothetical protein